jgi:hypothetical protein
MCLEILKTPQVDRLASPELPHDDPRHRVVRTGRQVAIRRIAAEIDELANYVLDIGS